MSKFTNISDIKAANKAAGRYWFSPENVKTFKARVISRIYDAGTNVDYPEGSRLWVESTWTGNETKWNEEFKIARFNVANHGISYVNVDYRTLRFSTSRAAVKYLEDNLL